VSLSDAQNAGGLYPKQFAREVRPASLAALNTLFRNWQVNGVYRAVLQGKMKLVLRYHLFRMPLRFSWDPQKAESNWARHGDIFEEAVFRVC
jgi:hypothetical protein